MSENLQNVIKKVEPVLDALLNYMPERHKTIIKDSFDNIIDLAQQFALAKIQNDELAIARTEQSLQHAITALSSTIISGISSLEDPVKEFALTTALRFISVLIANLFSIIKQ